MNTVWIEQNVDAGIALMGQSDGPAQDASEEARDVPLPGMLMSAGVLLLVFLALSSLRRRMRQQAKQSRATPRERIDAIQSQAKKRQMVDGYMADAEELTRRLAAHLDNKAAWLEKLIEDADDRIRRLELIEHRQGQEPQQTTAPRIEPGEDPIKRRIYELADQGLRPIEIAKELDQHTGKIELVLALRRA